MTLSWFLALLMFILVAGFTPGPNNIIAMSIGFNHGYRKVLPHVAGVTVGFPVMLILIGLVLKPIMQEYEQIFMLLKYASIAYIIYIAYHVATQEPSIDGLSSDKKPIGFWQSVAFQWINPKAWAGALATVTLYMPKGYYTQGVYIAALLSAVTIIAAISAWAIMGKGIKGFLSHPKQVRVFNVVMALLLLLSVGMMLF